MNSCYCVGSVILPNHVACVQLGYSRAAPGLVAGGAEHSNVAGGGRLEAVSINVTSPLPFQMKDFV